MKCGYLRQTGGKKNLSLHLLESETSSPKVLVTTANSRLTEIWREGVKTETVLARLHLNAI